MGTTHPTPPIALITGGSRGLGRSSALQLAERGSDVIITYQRAEAEAQAVVAQVERLGRRAEALALDVSDSAGFDDFVRRLRAVLDRLWQRERFDHLVNNAGRGAHAGFAETTEAQFDALVDVHFKGVFFLTQALLPLIADGGRIVNLSTGLTRFSAPGFAAYAAANIARTDGWTTGWVACLVGWSTFLLPFLFVLTPSLLMDGSTPEIVLNLARVLFGIYLGTAAVVGFALAPLARPMRAVYVVLALAVVLPPEAFAGAIWINAAGILAAAILLGYDHLQRRMALPQRERA